MKPIHSSWDVFLKHALENSVNQEHSLVLGELEAVPSTVIGFHVYMVVGREI